MDDRLNRVVSAEQFVRKDSQLAGEIEGVERELARFDALERLDLPRVLAFAGRVLSNLKATYVAASPKTRAAIAAELFDRVTIAHGKVRTCPKGRLLTYLGGESTESENLASPT